MQPYQEASDEIKRQSEEPAKALSAITKTAAGLAGGSAILNRISPLLNKFIPNEMALKGLEKVDPRFGKFIKGAISKGHSVEEVRDFIQEQVSPQGKEQLEEENVIKQFSPKLAKLIDSSLKSGRTLEEVSGIAMSPEHKHSKTIENMEKSLGMTLYDIIRSVYGGPKRGQQPAQAEQQGQQQPQAQQQAQASPAQQQQAQQMQQANQVQQQTQAQAQQAQGGNSDAALMAALDKILKM